MQEENRWESSPTVLIFTSMYAFIVFWKKKPAKYIDFQEWFQKELELLMSFFGCNGFIIMVSFCPLLWDFAYLYSDLYSLCLSVFVSFYIVVLGLFECHTSEPTDDSLNVRVLQPWTWQISGTTPCWSCRSGGRFQLGRWTSTPRTTSWSRWSRRRGDAGGGRSRWSSVSEKHHCLRSVHLWVINLLFVNRWFTTGPFLCTVIAATRYCSPKPLRLSAGTYKDFDTFE